MKSLTSVLGLLLFLSNATAQCDRDLVMQAYEENFVSTATSNAEIAWTGNADNCTPGEVSQLAREHALTRINYFRDRVGLGPVAYDDALNAKAQQAALMMHSERALDHYPDSTFACFTEEGREAAGKSNLAYGTAGAGAVNAYIADRGASNIAVGHRRWIMFSRAKTIGQGFTTNADAMWVIGNNGPSTFTGDFMAWPTPGVNPSPITPLRWSFTIPRANFSNAQVRVEDVYGNIRSITQHEVVNGFGDNTLVWEMNDRSDVYATIADVTYTVFVDDVLEAGEMKNYSYQVTISNPTQSQDCGTGLTWNEENCACEQQSSSVSDAWSVIETFAGITEVTILDMAGRKLTNQQAISPTRDELNQLVNNFEQGFYIALVRDLTSGKLASVRLARQH